MVVKEKKKGVKKMKLTHLLADFSGCKRSEIEKVSSIRSILKEAVQSSDLKEVGQVFHQFKNPLGVTGLILLTSSHIALHTWPEKGYVALDIFSCDKKKKVFKAFEVIRSELKPTKIRVDCLDRG